MFDFLQAGSTRAIKSANEALISWQALSAWDLALNQRARFWPRGRHAEEWFSYREFANSPDFVSRARELVRSAVALLEQAEAWWAGGSAQPNVF